MGSLLIVTGPPGSGKSTVSSLLATRLDRSVLVEGDAFFGFLANGAISPWLGEAHQQNQIVTEAAAQATGRLARSYDTIYDGVVGPWFLDSFAQSAAIKFLDYVILLPSVDLCVERVRSRAGHGFTNEAATRSMHTKFSEADIPRRHIISSAKDTVHLVETIVDLQASGTVQYFVP